MQFSYCVPPRAFLKLRKNFAAARHGPGSGESNSSHTYTVMAGARPVSHNVKIENEPTDTATYAFELPNSDFLFAFWMNGVTEDDVSGEPTPITFPGGSTQTAVGINVVHGFEQELFIEVKENNLVIRNLMIKDYPIIIRLVN